MELPEQKATTVCRVSTALIDASFLEIDGFDLGKIDLRGVYKHSGEATKLFSDV